MGVNRDDVIELPDFEDAFEYENNFYLSCGVERISKLLAHYELYRMTEEVPGTIVECGVFKGASFVRFATFRELFSNPYSRTLVGFDTFGEFPETDFGPDEAYRENFIDSAGNESISAEQLTEVLSKKGIEENYELIEGDITETVPEFVEDNPELKISLLNLDVDLYEPTKTILHHLYPRIVNGGLLVLDDYGTFPGETKAVDEYFEGRDVEIRTFPFCMTPSYLIKRAP